MASKGVTLVFTQLGSFLIFDTICQKRTEYFIASGANYHEHSLHRHTYILSYCRKICRKNNKKKLATVALQKSSLLTSPNLCQLAEILEHHTTWQSYMNQSLMMNQRMIRSARILSERLGLYHPPHHLLSFHPQFQRRHQFLRSLRN